jgi:hypothetical protein
MTTTQTTTRLDLANDIATIAHNECLLDVTLCVDGIEVTLTVRATIDELHTITWTPERILGACWEDGTEIVVDRAFCPADWEARLREHNTQIEAWVCEWKASADAKHERHAATERGLRMLGIAS